MTFQVRSLLALFPEVFFFSSSLLLGERGVHSLNVVINTKGSEKMTLVPETNSKLTPIQERIQNMQGLVREKMALLLGEPSRNLTDTPENRAKVARMVKGAAAQYGPRLVQPEQGDFIAKFDAARLMYQPRADRSEGFDLGDFLSSGEEYTGETHLAVLCSWDAWLDIVRRVYQGLEAGGAKTDDGPKLGEQLHLRRLAALVRVLRHVETFSCWRDEGTDEKTGKTFLFSWPKEQALFPNSFHAFSVQERAYATDDINSFGLKWHKRPVLEEDEAHGPDDTVHPADAKRRTAKKHNSNVKELGNFIGE